MAEGAALGVFFAFAFDTAVVEVGEAAAVEAVIAPFAAAFRLVVTRPVFQSVASPHQLHNIHPGSGLPLGCICAELSTVGSTTTSGGGVGGLLSNCPQIGRAHV